MRKSSQDRLLRLAREQFKRCEDYENPFRKAFTSDVMFANADPDNAWQWPNDLYRNRQLQQRPTLTTNNIRPMNNRIVNEIKMNPPGIIVRPTGGLATKQSAKAWSGMMREITRRSRFTNIVTRAARFQVDGGVGYWRVTHEWEDEKAFVQRIAIKSLKNMLGAYLDPDAKEPDKSDAKFGFIFEDVLRKQAERDYPQIKDMGAYDNTLNANFLSGWTAETHYRVAEWWNLETVKDEAILYVDPDTGEENTCFLSQIPNKPLSAYNGQSIRDVILADPMTMRREIDRPRMKYRKIIGSTIVDEYDWPGRYVPIIQVVGDEVEVDGKLDRKGNTRNLKDSQRMQNFWNSAATQQVALQSKVPYIVDLRGIEGYETYWASANIVDHAYLPYRSLDSNGQPIEKPQRMASIEMAQGFIVGMQIAERQMMTMGGQRDLSQEADRDNLQSGRAIRERKTAGDEATFHFRDNIDIAVAHTGRVILDMANYVYDTQRQIMTIQEDGEEAAITLDPGSSEPYTEKKKPGEENSVDITFNHRLGSYDVDAFSGPDFSTQRQYAVEAMSTVVAANKELWGVVGDLLVKNMDFPGAEEMAERIRRTIPKEVLGEGPDAQMQALMQQNQQLTQLIENFTALLAEKNLELKNKDEKLTIDAMDAETRRIKELGNAQENFEALGLTKPLQTLIMQTIADALKQAGLPSSVTQSDDEQGKFNMDGANPDTGDTGITPPGLPKPTGTTPVPVPQPKHPKGKIAPDGNEYVEHAPGQFAKVDAQEAQ
jgi:hypothetical protein